VNADFSARDDLARDEIRTLLGETLFVEAGAGTGKTAALVERYLALVLNGRQVDRIIAITFTDKAAAELRDRVRQRLESQLRMEVDSDRRKLVEDALAGIDRAQISTIHAFCQGLLRAFAVRSGVDPAFEIDDEVAAERRFEERWRSFLEGLGSDPFAVDKVGRALDLGLTTRNLQDLAHALWAKPELAERLRAQPLIGPDCDWPDLEDLRRRLTSISMRFVPDNDSLRRRVDMALNALEDLIATGDERDARLVTLTAKLNPRTGTLGNQTNWKGSHQLEEARRITSEVIQTLLDTRDGLRSNALAALLPLVVRFVVDEVRERGREGRLVFDDLILRVRNTICGSDRDALFQLRQRFDALLIDEFQDTDPLQAQIAMAFAIDPSSNKPEPGRLFLVGDPKQSIYRFRRADMAMYARTAGSLAEAGARKIDLSLNRRSQPELLEWVNNVFARAIGEGLITEVQPLYKPVAPQRSGGLRGPAVAWFGGPTAAANAAEVRRLEAGRIASHCRDIVRQGWEVQDRRGGSVRAAAFRDIAVLLPARTILQSLERALAAQAIPYRVEGGSLVYATQEIRDLINCLTAIDDPSDDVAVVAALRSPAYACSDVEIARHRLLDGRRFNYLAPDLASAQGRVAEALHDLVGYHKLRANLPLSALVETFINDRRLAEIGLLDTGTRDAFRRTRFLIEQARRFESNGPESLRAFVEWLERRAGEAILDHEGAGLDDDEDAVRVLTIHAAKGLEFPIVILAGLGTTPRYTGEVFGHNRATSTIAVKIGAATRGAQFTLGPIDAVAMHEREHELAERDRLLYVGATRARDHLVVSLFHKAGVKDTAAGRLIDCGAMEYASPYGLLEVAESSPDPGFQDLDVEVPNIEEDDFAEHRAALIAGARTLRPTSATALGRWQPGGGEHDSKDEREDETEPWSRGRAGTHLGRAVHAALQSLPWDADEALISAVATAQTVAEAIPHQAEHAARLIGAALRSPAAERARRASRATREVPFAFQSDSFIVEGFADLVIEHEDGSIEIVDWKTDQVPASAIPERLLHYQTQAGLYVLGLLNATGRPVSRVAYVFVSAEQEHSPGNPEELAARALEAIQTAAMSA
jgi:ATP-dependent helicase/nuclease subunit A